VPRIRPILRLFETSLHAKFEALGQFEQSPDFSKAERAALHFAQAAGKAPNAVGDVEFADLRRHFDDDQILEMTAVLALMGFLNRWNDTLATPLEAGPRNFAECRLAANGWSVGKHLDAGPLDPQPARSIPLGARLFLWLLRRWRPKLRP